MTLAQFPSGSADRHTWRLAHDAGRPPEVIELGPRAAELAVLFSTSLRSCATHGAGPIVSYERAVDAYCTGELDDDEWTNLGRVVAHQALTRWRAEADDSPDRRALRIVYLAALALFAEPPDGETLIEVGLVREVEL